MLASISPLGERARGNRWAITAGAYALGSVAAAVATGIVLGAAGAAIGLERRVAWPALAVVAGIAGVVDLAAPGRIPTITRQVNEDWLAQYRGWVYGWGFGVELGVGVATIVTTSTIYAWLAGAFLAASPAIGALAGLTFGLARAAPLVLVRGATSPDGLRTVLRRVSSRATVSRVVAAGVAVASAVAAGAHA
jgi:sulfite exporter TauE/SafE